MMRNIVLTTLAVCVSSYALAVQAPATTATAAQDASQALMQRLLQKVDNVYKGAIHQFDRHKTFCEDLHKLVLVDSDYIKQVSERVDDMNKKLDVLVKSTQPDSSTPVSSNPDSSTPVSSNPDSSGAIKKEGERVRPNGPDMGYQIWKDRYKARHKSHTALKPKTLAALKERRKQRMEMRKKIQEAANGKIKTTKKSS